MTKSLTAIQLKKIAESKDAISLVNSWLNANTAYQIVQSQVMDIKIARKIAKMIRELDVILFGLPDGEVEKHMRESRRELWLTLDKGGWNLNVDYKLVNIS